jgi:hypothetical protein
MNIFDFLNEISYNKREWKEFTPEQQAAFDPYMIHRFISMKQDYIEVVNEIQFTPMPKDILYNLWCKILPKKKTFFRYIKPKKGKINPKLINILAKRFALSEREIKDNYHLIGEDLSRDILLNIGMDEKQIKTLLK